MLRLICYIGMLLIGTIVQSTVLAQHKNKAPQSVTNLFNDLPVNDASPGSVLDERETAAEKIAHNIFVTTSLNTNRCFVGEPVLFTGTLYSALQSNSVIQTAPALPGFVTTEMSFDNDKPQYKTIASKNYRVFTIRRLQLLPVQEGALIIEPMVVKNTVQYTDESDHEQAYSGTVLSELLKLKVKPLPVNGRTTAFTGLIGAFSMKITVARSQLAAWEADTLHIVISGSGNFTECKLPMIAWPDGIEHFPAKDQLTLDANSFPFTGNKTFDIPFTVLKPGTLLLPAISLAYFDPATALYKTITSRAIAIDVLPAVTDKKVAPAEKISRNYFSWIGVSAIALLLTMTTIYYVRKRLNSASGTPKHITNLQSATVPVDYINLINDLQHIQSAEQYLGACKNILYTFIEKELGIRRISEEALIHQLQQQQSPLASAVQQLLKVCNQLLYSPGVFNETAKQDIAERLARIVKGDRSVTRS